MNFSEPFKHTGGLCRYSYNGLYLANSVQYRLIVRNSSTLQIERLYSCLDVISSMEWSPDSKFVLTVCQKRGCVQVWSIEEPDWKCKVDEGSAGLVSACWSPDSRHIMTISDFFLRITVWSLTNKTVAYIKYPKQCKQSFDFSKDGWFLALAERRDCKDCISVFSCSSWQLLKHFQTKTDDFDGVSWSPDGSTICVWEDSTQYKALFYSADGHLLFSFSAYDLALGIKSLSWASSSQFIAIGSYDQNVRLLNDVTWTCVGCFQHPSYLWGPNKKYESAIVYQEMGEESSFDPSSNTNWYEVISIDKDKSKFVIPAVKPEMNKANPKIGIGLLDFSPDSSHVYSRNDNMPNVLWIWQIVQLRLVAVLVQIDPIKSVSWDPCAASGSPRLALCTGGTNFYMWSPAGSLSVLAPPEATFDIDNIRWHPFGDSILLFGREDMCVCFLPETIDVVRTH